MSDENVQSPLISKNVFDEEPLPRKRFRVSKSLSSRSTSVGNCPVQRHKVTREERGEKLGKYNGYRGCTVWLTGLSGAGKTTIAFAVEKVLTELGLPTYGLDGDNVRNGLCKNLGFSKEDRCENIRRVAEVAKLFADMGIITLASFISPYRIDRDEARRIHEKDNISFFEVYLNTPLSICEQRDPKKFYEKARAGKLKGFTGIDSDYEAPENADLILKAGEWSESECVRRLLGFLHEKLIIPVEAIRSLDKLLVRELMVLGDEAKQALVREASEIPKIEITDIDKQWLQVLAEGWATPLTGFMRERQYLQCLHHGQIFDLKKKCTEPGSSLEAIDNSDIISSPVNQSVPIVLPITSEQRLSLLTGTDGELCKTVGLTYKGKLLAVLRDPEIYQHRKEERVARQFGITDRRHPTISMIMSSGDWLLGGDIEVLHRITYGDGLDEYRLTPTELRQRFRDEDCDAVFAFQLRNPIHNGHALLMRDTRKQLLKKFKNPMLLLHPLGGWTKDDDVPLKVRIEQHKAVLSEGILDPKWTVLAIFPSPMLYAGPTEVQWHARARIAAGVTTYIVGRDPAGIAHPETGDYLYDPTHGAKVLTMAPGMSALHIIPFRVAAYDKKKGEMDFFDPKRKDDFLFISGTKMRKYARDGIQPPDGFMAPKAWEILSAYYRERNATQK